jgi:hypothetical protein
LRESRGVWVAAGGTYMCAVNGNVRVHNRQETSIRKARFVPIMHEGRHAGV